MLVVSSNLNGTVAAKYVKIKSIKLCCGDLNLILLEEMAPYKLRSCRVFCHRKIGKFEAKLALICLIAVSIMHFSSYQHVNKISVGPLLVYPIAIGN